MHFVIHLHELMAMATIVGFRLGGLPLLVLRQKPVVALMHPVERPTVEIARCRLGGVPILKGIHALVELSLRVGGVYGKVWLLVCLFEFRHGRVHALSVGLEV